MCQRAGEIKLHFLTPPLLVTDTYTLRLDVSLYDLMLMYGSESVTNFLILNLFSEKETSYLES